MAQGSTLDWQRIVADPRFQALHRKKTSFLWGLMVFSIVYYFLLPIGAAYFQDIYKIKVWGPVNVGLLFALSEFIVAWGIAFIYSRRANSEFDAMAGELIRDAEKIGGRQCGAIIWPCSSSVRRRLRHSRHRPLLRAPSPTNGAGSRSSSSA